MDEIAGPGIYEVADPRPIIFLHIGAGKAGSTAIQEFLRINSELLQLRGIGVAHQNMDLDFSKQASPVSFFERAVGSPIAADLILRAIEALAAEFQRKSLVPLRALIISAENLSNNNGLEPHFSALKKRFRIIVVLYIRQQEEALQSAWQQWHVKTGNDLDFWLKTSGIFSYDWAEIIRRWEGIGPEQIRVRIFDRQSLFRHDVAQDFALTIGLEGEGLLFPKEDKNVSYGVHVSDLFASVPGIFKDEHDVRIDRLFLRLGVQAAKKYTGETIFGPDQLALIKRAYAESNKWVHSHYFPERQSDFLFPAISGSALTRPTQTEINRRNIALLAEVLLKSNLGHEEINPEDRRKPSRATAAPASSMLARLDYWIHLLLASAPLVGQGFRHRFARAAERRRVRLLSRR